MADDMGLGKTLQTITLLLEQSKEGASLVIAPASVVPNWRNELKRFSPTLNVIVLNQSDDRSKAIKDAQSGDVVIATYALLNTQQEELTKQLVSVAEQNIALIDETIGFAGSELATQILGEEGAANLLQHAKDIKAEGAEFCDCAACVAAKNIIDLKAEIM